MIAKGTSDRYTNSALTADLQLLQNPDWQFVTILIDMLKNFAAEVSYLLLSKYKRLFEIFSLLSSHFLFTTSSSLTYITGTSNQLTRISLSHSYKSFSKEKCRFLHICLDVIFGLVVPVTFWALQHCPKQLFSYYNTLTHWKKKRLYWNFELHVYQSRCTFILFFFYPASH